MLAPGHEAASRVYSTFGLPGQVDHFIKAMALMKLRA